jgi:hypothetical protein
MQQKKTTDYKSKGKVKKLAKKGKKHVNSKKTIYNSVLYASISEAFFAEECDKHGLKFLYEPETIELQPSFKFQGKTVQNMSYTRDFDVVSPQGKLFCIELKGRKTDRWMITVKLIKYYFYLNRPFDIYIVCGTNKTDLLKLIDTIKNS